jgi:hypothetical protein
MLVVSNLAPTSRWILNDLGIGSGKRIGTTCEFFHLSSAIKCHRYHNSFDYYIVLADGVRNNPEVARSHIESVL